MDRLTIVTLGTGGEAFLTRGVERALRAAGRRARTTPRVMNASQPEPRVTMVKRSK